MPRPSTASSMNVAATAREWSSRSTYTGAGAAVPTKVRGLGQVLTRQGVGLYTITFTDVGGSLVGLDGVTHTAATVAPQEWKLVAGSFTQASKASAIECWSAVGALADPPAASLVDLYFTFVDGP